MLIETLDPVGGVALKLNVIRIKWAEYQCSVDPD